jgi:MoaA/NifB/PqqE/SkfB family radical SAM enzyme
MYSVQIGDVEAIDIECTTFCNLHCPECLREIDNEWVGSVLNSTHITRENCEEWFNPDDLVNFNELRFCGAIDEAAANPHLIDILNYFNEAFVPRYDHLDAGFFIDIRTNGSLKTTAWWEKLAQTLPSNHRVVFGIDGADEVSEIYRVGSNFKKVINNATAFINAGGLAAWQFIEFEHNKHQVEEAQQKSIDLGFRAFDVMASSRDDRSGDIEHTKNVSVSIIAKAEKRTRTQITCINQTPPGDSGPGMGKRILINSLGLVTPCCFLNGFTHMPFAYKIKNPENHPPFYFHEPVWNKIWQSHPDTALSLHHHSLKEILAGDFFSDIEASWTTKKPIERCLEVCGKQVVDETKWEHAWRSPKNN